MRLTERRMRSYIHQAETRCRILFVRSPGGTECASGTTRVDKELAFQFVSLEFVGASPKQDIDVHLPGCYVESIGIAMRYYGMSVCKTYAHISMLNNFTQRQIGRVHIIVAFDNV